MTMDSHPDNLKIYDSSWESWVDMRRFGPASRWLRTLIADACCAIDTSPNSIHDVGCGEGIITQMVAQRYPKAEVRGSDFSASGIALAQRHFAQKNLTFIHDPDNREMDQKADLVCCFEVLEHVDEWRPFLARLANGSNRYLLLSFPTGRMRPFEVNMGHMRNFAWGEAEAELKKIGFRPIQLAYAGFPFYSPLYREVCQLTNAGDAQFTRGKYGIGRKFISAIIYALFRYGSSRRRHGDQFVGLFARDEQHG